MSTGIDDCGPSEAIRAVVMSDPRVQSVQLVGSRAAGMATVLSDWAYRISPADRAAVAERLPGLVGELRPLAQLWDPLAASSVYMVVLPGAVKDDLFLAARRPAGPRTRSASLDDIDDHFWDWNLWLGSKRLRGLGELVSAELTKMWVHLLRSLGATSPPATQQRAITDYLAHPREAPRVADGPGLHHSRTAHCAGPARRYAEFIMKKARFL